MDRSGGGSPSEADIEAELMEFLVRRAARQSMWARSIWSAPRSWYGRLLSSMTWIAVSMEAATATMAFLGLAACRSLRRTRGRARLPVPLHVSGGDREQQTPLALYDRGVTFRWEDDRARA